MFGNSYGVYCVMGNFGSGKTSGSFLDLSKVDKRKTYIIANVKYDFVDQFFNTKQELNRVLDSIINYCKLTNQDIKKYYEEREQYKDIILVVDEAHLYFDSRNWKEYSSSLDVILSQCRKRNIKVLFVSQRLKRVDLNIRRLADFVIRYRRERKPIFVGFERVKRYVYANEGDLADIQGDDQKTYIMNGEQQKTELEQSEIDRDFFTPLFKWQLGKLKREPFKGEWSNLSDQKHLSLFISGLESDFVNLNDPFLKKIKIEEISDIEKPKPRSFIEYIPTFTNLWTQGKALAVSAYIKLYSLYKKYAGSNRTPRRGNHSKQFIAELKGDSGVNIDQ